MTTTYELSAYDRVSAGIYINKDGSMCDLIKISTAAEAIQLKGEELETIYKEYQKRKGETS